MMAAAPISLYFDLPKDESPDLEVIARASIAWSGLIKEVISIVDPSLSVRVEFLSGTIGSRSINSIIRTSQKVAIAHPWTSGALAAITGVFLLAPVNHVANDLTAHLAKVWLGHEDSGVTDADVERIAKRVIALQRDKVAVERKGEIFKEAGSDEVITGVGATPMIGTPSPSLIIPRSEFAVHRSGDLVTQEETIERRTKWKYDYPVTIVRSYSKAEERRWKFEHGSSEFSATMRDPEFLAAIKSGHTGVEIGEGVEIRINLRIKEEKGGGVWREKELDVMKVIWPDIGRQPSLQFTPN